MTDAPDAVEARDCPMCEAPAGSPCRTRGGKVAPKYHTGRIMLVPKLRDSLEVRTPADRGPGRAWRAGPVLAAAPIPAADPNTVVRIGYCRTSMVSQELQSQLDALDAVGCLKVYAEQISTRIPIRPQLEAAISHARTIKEAVPGQTVLLTVHELKRLGRGSAELITTANGLMKEGIGLEMLTGPLAGVYNPSGHGAALFAFFAAMAESEREYIREKTLEGQEASRANGRHGGRPNVADDHMADYAKDLRAKGVPVAEIRTKLFIPSGKNKGKHPSLATVYRLLAEDQPAQA